MYNAKYIIIAGIIIATISSITTYAWNHQTLDEMVEQNNREAIIDCLTEARTKETSQAILQATADCNSHLFTTVSSPLVSTGYLSTGTVNLTPVSEVPLGLKSTFHNSESEPKKSIIASVEKKLKIGDTLDANPVSKKETSRSPTQIYEQVKHLGYREEPTVALVKSCKDGSLEIQKCILFGLIIMYNESGNNQKSNACISRKNCFGVKSGKRSYSSLDEGTENWVLIFNRFWYKAESPSFFYSSKGKLSPSRYCVSENSSNSEIGCPNGLMVANKKYEQLYPIIYLK